MLAVMAARRSLAAVTVDFLGGMLENIGVRETGKVVGRIEVA